MKRFKNWIHGSLWAVIFGLGLYVLVKGVSIAGGGKNLTRKTAQLYAPVFTLAPVKGTENQSWLSLLTKEVVPLLTYWESKESYFLSEEPQLTVREETEKNPESEKTQETQKSALVRRFASAICQAWPLWKGLYSAIMLMVFMVTSLLGLMIANYSMKQYRGKEIKKQW